MDYSAQTYIKKLATETLEQFLQQWMQTDGTDNANHIITDVQNELARRTEDNV